MRRVTLLSMIFLAIFIILLGFSSAACVNPSQTIITLYSQSNSHVAIYNSTNSDPNAVVSICYDEIFGQGYPPIANPWECNIAGQNNLVVGIYGVNNSHVAAGEALNICYGDLSCNIVSGSPGSTSCPGSDKFVMSISDLTNAHAAKDGSYSYKVCCQNSPSTPIVKEITFANWTQPESGAIIKFINFVDYVNLSVKSLNIADGQKINISVYNSSNNALLFLDPLSIQVRNNQINYRTNLPSLNVTNNVGVGGKIYFNASYIDSTGSLVSNVRSDDIEIVDYAINSAKWLDLSNDSITRIIKGDLAQIYGNTTGFFGKSVTISLYLRSTTNIFVRNYLNYIIGPTGEVILKVNLSEEYSNSGLGSLSSGDKLFFIINNSDGFHKVSPDIRIGDITVDTSGCCENLVDQATCDASTPLGSRCINANITPSSCTGKVVTKCSWDSSASKCNTRAVLINPLNQEILGSCTTSYTNVDSECVDGFRRISIAVSADKGTCSTDPLCSDPCEGGVCTVPCRNVALLPFFSTIQMVIALCLAILTYFLIKDKL